jgi:radical SAM superfamily enzyme YgiQ (UPF0313 family)
MTIDLLLVKTVTGGPEAFFSSTEVNHYNMTRDIPLPSIPVLDSWIRSKGYTTVFFDLDKNSPEALLEKAKEAHTIGFHLNYSSHYRVMDAVVRVKKKYPEKFVVIGGPSITNFKEDFYNISVSRFFGLSKERPGNCVDAIVYGEGEIPLETILQHKDNRDEIGRLIDSDHESSWGIIYRDTNGKLHISKKPGLITDLSLLPVPSFELNKGLLPIAFIETTRGCTFKCPFCEIPGMYDTRRVKDKKQVEAEIDRVQQLGFKHVIITDPAIYPSKRMDMFSELFAGRDMVWTGYAKPGVRTSKGSLYSKETLQKAHDSGCISLFFGGESASEKTQEMYGKPRIEVLEETERLCKEVGLLSCWSFMILNPGETSRDIDDLFELLMKMNPEMSVFSPFLILPDSQIDKQPQEFNLRITDPDYKMKVGEFYSMFSKSAGADRKVKIRHLVKNHPRLMRLVLKFLLRKTNYYRCIETGYGLADGAFEMLRLDAALNERTSIKSSRSNYHLIFEMAATGETS